jgi:hypothetical protein
MRDALGAVLSHPLAMMADWRDHPVLEADPMIAKWAEAIDQAKDAHAKANGQAIEQTPEPAKEQPQRQQRRAMELSR